MKLPADLVTPYPPRLRGLSSDESQYLEAYKSIENNLLAMSQQTSSLISAIYLFNYCNKFGVENRLTTSWQFIAARDGAMSMRNFARAIATVRGAIGKIPHWLDLVDIDSLKTAHLQFQEWFPFVHKLRNSVAHPELYANPNKKMGITGNIVIGGVQMGGSADGKITINQGLINNYFSSTFEGEVVEYQLSKDTCIKVLETCNISFSSFSNISLGWP